MSVASVCQGILLNGFIDSPILCIVSMIVFIFMCKVNGSNILADNKIRLDIFTNSSMQIQKCDLRGVTKTNW